MKKRKNRTLKFCGTVEKGIGKGKHYLSIPEYSSYFEKLLGKPPYPGTLNLRISDKTGGVIQSLYDFKEKLGIYLGAFEKYGVRYHSGTSLCCKIIISTKKIPGIIYFPEKTSHPPEIIELIAGEKILDRCKLGEPLCVEVGNEEG